MKQDCCLQFFAGFPTQNKDSVLSIMHKFVKNDNETQENSPKDIHNQKRGFSRKNELYTKLSTLSTGKKVEYPVYIVCQAKHPFCE